MALRLLSHPSLTAAQLRQLHGHLLTSSLLGDRYLPNILLRGLLPDAPLRALALFPRLRRILPAFLPNNYTFSFLLTASIATAIPIPSPSFTSSAHTQLICALHALAVTLGWDAHAYVSNGFIHAYASRGFLDAARRVFDTAVLARTDDVCSWTSLLTAYARAGHMDDARSLFDGMPHKTPIAWSAMLSAHVGAGGFVDALEVFDMMLSARIRPNRAAIVGALAACGGLGALEQGRWVHALITATTGRMDAGVATALVDMYAKCGNLDSARQVFAAMPEPERDVFAYTAMISGLSDHGHCQEAVELFGQMQDQGVRPNEVTFICVLCTCARAGGGLVSVAREIFQSMSAVHGIEPGVEHYGSLVDVLGRAGMLAEAAAVVRAMPMRPDSYVLGALLNACRVHGGDGVKLGKQVVEWLAELGLDHSGVHVQLSNMYACSSKWEDVVRIRSVMEEKKVAKVPGCSMVEVDGVACEFVAGDRFLDPCINTVVRGLDQQLRLLGHDYRHLEELSNLA
ncbi:pentatricopeptide repeat-containing protein At5g66520-like [Triticum dicoccoides]|uniref:Pentatricopeptide repeat-containing protein n=2 Tax=Triticum TaxID=4564 RepID=A0A9R1NPG9_TRITD|nr:pentatricopeptide repeat-containing protein At5g66520-like [Triticum dicoccoides]XP_044456155.1 pentatricopeptide repeat-containing protein At5g66520-like [Triticum aestivum]VAH28695.1 unnamed protein product [Triticum turgidum subsp. durum]